MQSVVGVAMVPEAILEKLEPMGMAKRFSNKTLGRALGPHANGAWLNKLTE